MSLVNRCWTRTLDYLAVGVVARRFHKGIDDAQNYETYDEEKADGRPNPAPETRPQFHLRKNVSPLEPTLAVPCDGLVIMVEFLPGTAVSMTRRQVDWIGLVDHLETIFCALCNVLADDRPSYRTSEVARSSREQKRRRLQIPATRDFCTR